MLRSNFGLAPVLILWWRWHQLHFVHHCSISSSGKSQGILYLQCSLDQPKRGQHDWLGLLAGSLAPSWTIQHAHSGCSLAARSLANTAQDSTSEHNRRKETSLCMWRASTYSFARFLRKLAAAAKTSAR